MGGKVLELASDKRFAQGRAEGRAEERIKTLMNLFTRGGTEEQAKAFLDATDEEITVAKKKIKHRS